MAKVSTTKVYFDGAEFKRTVSVDAKGVFSINLPQPVVDRLVLAESVVRGRTLADAENAEQKLLAEYKAAQTSTRKCIVYRVELNFTPDPEEHWQKREDISFAPGIAVAVWAGVYTETMTLRAGKPPVYRYEHEKSSLPREVEQHKFDTRVGEGREREKRQMDWTPERERFFCRVGELLHGLALKLHEMTAEPEAFAQLAEAMASAPLLAEKKGTEEHGSDQ